MANEASETQIHYLFKREPKPIQHVPRSRTKKCFKETKNKECQQMCNLTHWDTDYTNSSKKCVRDNSMYVYVHKKKRQGFRKSREYNIYRYTKDEITAYIKSTKKRNLPRYYSLYELQSYYNIKKDVKRAQSSDFLRRNKKGPYSRNYIVNNCCRTCDKPECGNPFINPSVLAKVYRCQIAAEDTCCCSCNSDAMFEVMKSLYDCYKKKNCENCNCILCGFGKQQKSVGVGEEEVAEDLLKGKSKEDKEKLLRDMVKNKKPLPIGKTASDKALINKIRKEMGLPPEPTNDAERKKLKRAYEKGIITPLEGKTPEEKEKALKKMYEAGIPLPEGRTPSEKALIEKVKATTMRRPTGIPSEKFQKAKAEGFITPLKGKTPEQREKILKGLAKNGIPLPEGKTPSEKQIIDKIRKELGLPPEPKNEAERKKLQKAYADGIVTPLEGKTPEQKEKALRRMAEAGIPLPEGRTPSEKALIEKVKATTVKRPTGIPSEKFKKAKAAGFITPLKGKTPEQKEKILRGLVQHGIPLPEGETPSEKKLIEKLRKELGLPPEPKNEAERKKLQKAYADGIVTPLEGKTPEQKEKALRRMAEAGIPLPEGRTPSEKALIDKVKATTKPKAVPSEKLRKAKAEGLLTPLEGKTPEQKETILRGLAKHGIPLPEGKTPSEKKLIDKIRKELGLPPEPKTASEKLKLEKAYADGIISPLEGKTPEQKEKSLRRMAEAGIPLPEGRTPSEKALIDKVKATTFRKPTGIPTEKFKKAKAEGFITPLKGKTPEQKEKILRGLAKHGIPLPKGETPSEKQLIDKIRKDLGLPPEPKTSSEKKKLKQAYADGIITPLEGKTPEQKEKILKRMVEAGIPLPEGRTPSEKALIDKVKATTVKRPTGVPEGFPSAKLRKAKAEGFITPLKGKTPEQKEKILRGLAKNGIPLPEGKTPSEKQLIDKIRKELGLPPEPKTSAERKKINQAYKDGIITPLEGKTPEQKEKALKRMVEAGIPLPEGRTPSEKALIDKVKATTAKRPSFLPEGIPSEKIKKAKAEGLITPLTGKTPEQKEKILRGLAKHGIPLPEGKTPSEKKLIDKVRKELGLPPEPKTSAERKKINQAYKDGIITPLEGKTPEQKEKALRRMAEAGIPLPEGRTPSEKALIDKIKATAIKRPTGVPEGIPSEKLRKALAEGLFTPLKGKTPEQKEKILRGLAKHGIPLPEGKTPSEKQLIDKLRKELGLPPEPKTSAERKKLNQAYKDGIITPLEGKTPEQKEKALRRMAEAGIPLPEGRTPSEKALIDKVKATAVKRPTGVPEGIPSAKLRKALAEGLFTPLKGKTPEQKEKILKGLAKHGIPLPEGKTPSEKQLIDKVRKELGLPPEPKTSAERKKLNQAYKDGIITPLEGKTPEQKEKALRRMAEAGIPLPEGRTPSEKALIDKIKATAIKRPTGVPEGIPSEKLRKALAEGLFTPLKGKTPEQKEKILKGLAKHGIPLPEGKTPSEKQLIDKVRKELGLPPEPKTSAERKKINQAYKDGIITPLEGKTPEQKEKALRRMAEAGIPLPEGRTPSEKALIDKIKATAIKRPTGVPEGIPSEKMRKALAEGLFTPLKGKTPEQKEKILKGLAKHGIPLPEGKTPSEKQLIDKVRKELGLPPEPKTSAERKKINQAYKDGIITPLEGKTPEQKEKALRRMAEAGIPLPEGRTPSEKALIDKVKATAVKRPTGVPAGIPSEKIRKALAEGLFTPLKGKTPEQKEKILKGLAKHGIPLPEGKTPSEKQLIDKVRKELGLPPEPKTSAERKKINQAYKDGIITPLEGKTPEQKEKALRRMAEAGIPLPEGRTPSEKALIDKIKATAIKRPTGVPEGIPSEKLRKALAEGLFTPLKGKTPEQKEKILKGLAKHGIPLPEGKTPSEKQLIDKVRKELGLPPEPKTSAERKKLNQAYKDGIITPLEGKTPEQKEKALRRMAEAGIPLPEGRTPSEKALIDKIKATAIKRPTGVPEGIPSEKMRKALAEGLFTPLKGKTPEQKEKILRGLAKHGIPLPEGKTPSEKQLIDKVRNELGLPPEPKTSAERKKLNQAYKDGIITPLEGKTPEQKEKALRRMAEAGIPLPEGRTPSEKALIDKIKATAIKRPTGVPEGIPSEKMRKALAEGLFTPLKGKTPEQKEKILRGLAKHGIPLPEGKTPSEKQLIDKVRKELGLPPEPKTSAERKKINQAYKDGIITPLEGKTPEQKEKALRRMAEAGIPLPEGRTPSEKALIDKVKATAVKRPTGVPAGIPSEKIRKALAEGLFTPLKGKTPEQKEKILRGLAKHGIPLPEGKTPSEKQLIDKVRKDLGLPPEPKTSAERKKINQAYKDGIITPLEGKTPAQKEKALRRMAEAGIPLPEGRTPSEKALIDKIKATAIKRPTGVPEGIPSEKMRKALAEGLFTPLKGKTPEQKEKILRGLAKHGIPLPEGKTPSEKQLIDKLRKELGLPPEPKTSAERKKLNQAYKDGIITPLEGKTPEQKEKALRRMAEAGIPLPEGRTPSEKALIDKVKATAIRRPTGVPEGIPSEKMRKALAEGLFTPLKGKTPEQKEKILRGLAKHGIPLPEGKTPSEKQLIDKVRKELGLPPEPKTSAERKKINQAYKDGIITPLEGKTPEQKEKALRRMAEAGIPLPEGRTPSEKALIDKVKATAVRRPTGVPAGIPSEKMRKAKAEGLITPLEGKTPEQKRKILEGLAKHGIPFPEGKTASEKKLMDDIRKEMGLPPMPKTPSEKAFMDRAYADGIITPLEGKTPEQKEKALEKMLAAGIPLPEGRTDSEKALIAKVKAKGPRPSEIKKKLKERGIGVKPEGIAAQELEEITKTTKCDRACGCDRKKIRFKHSYVKIRVTSPDISSFCDCPDECIPGVKGGVFVDNEGIKVTIGYSSVLLNYQSSKNFNSYVSKMDLQADQKFMSFCSAALGSEASIIKTPIDYSHKNNTIKTIYHSNENVSFKDVNYEHYFNGSSNTQTENYKLEENESSYSSVYMVSSNISRKKTDLIDDCSSYDSIVISTESSLSFSFGSQATELATISVISLDSSIISEFSNNILNMDLSNNIILDEPELRNIYSKNTYLTDSMQPFIIDEKNCLYNNENVTILRFTKTKKKNKTKDKKSEKKVMISEPNSENIMKIVAEEILNQTQKSDSSSIFVVMQSEGDNTNTDISSISSNGLKKYDQKFNLRESFPIVTSKHQLLVSSRGVKLTTIPKDFKEIKPVKKKISKSKNIKNPVVSNRSLENCDIEIDYLEKEIRRKKPKERVYDESIDVKDTKHNKKNVQYLGVSQMCSHHKCKVTEKHNQQKMTVTSVEPKQQLIKLSDKSNDKGCSVNIMRRPTKDKCTTDEIIETKRSFEACQKGLDTTCDRPCFCETKADSSKTDNPDFSDKPMKNLSAGSFVRESIPYLYENEQFMYSDLVPFNVKSLEHADNSNFYAEQQMLRNIQETFHHKFREHCKKLVEVDTQINCQIPTQPNEVDYNVDFNAEYQVPITSFDVNNKNIAIDNNTNFPQTATIASQIQNDDTNLCPECLTIHKSETADNCECNRHNEISTQDMVNANLQCPEILDIIIDQYLDPSTDCAESKEATDVCSNNYPRKYLGGDNTNKFSVSRARILKTPCAPPQTRKNTLMGEIYDQDSYMYKDQREYKEKTIPRPTMCNDCCIQGKITDCTSPGRQCNPCKRHRRSLPEGIKFSNTCHSKMHLEDVLIYEDSSHQCCCIPRPLREMPDEFKEETDPCLKMVNQCLEYCSGSSVEDIREAVMRFMTAREQGLVCATTDNEKNICDQTRELFQGIEQAIAERKNYSTKVARSVSDYSFEPSAANNCKYCNTNNNCLHTCPKLVQRVINDARYVEYQKELNKQPPSKVDKQPPSDVNKQSSSKKDKEPPSKKDKQSPSKKDKQPLSKKDKQPRFNVDKQLPSNARDNTTQKYPDPKLSPVADLQVLGRREKSKRRLTGPKDPKTCVCRAPKKKKPPLDNCVCPKEDRCECPSPTEEQWIDYYCQCLELTRKEFIKLQTELAHTSSGFKVMKKRKSCDIKSYEEALEYFSKNKLLESESDEAETNEAKTNELETNLKTKGNNKTNPDGRCPGCGDLNCPGLKKLEPFDTNPHSKERFQSRYATGSSQECLVAKCEDTSCPGMGPYGLLPPIPGGPVSDVIVTEDPERGPHKTCVCEPREDFERDIYCPPDGPVSCECALGSKVTCECGPTVSQSEEGGKKGRKVSKKMTAEEELAEQERRRIAEEERLAAEKLAAEKLAKEAVKVGDWDKGPCGPLGGFKLCLGAKGTASTGLQGICCFNAFESHSESRFKSASSASSTYVIYL